MIGKAEDTSERSHPDCLLLLLITFKQRYSPLSSRLSTLFLRVILNQLLSLLLGVSEYISTEVLCLQRCFSSYNICSFLKKL